MLKVLPGALENEVINPSPEKRAALPFCGFAGSALPWYSTMSMHRTSGRWKFGLVLSIFTALLWAGTPIALKVVLESMAPFTVAWYRFLFSAILMTGWVLIKHGPPPSSMLIGRVGLMLLLAALGLCANYALFMSGLDRIPPSSAVVVIQLAPMFLLFGGVLIFKESYSYKQFTGFLILASGLLLFFNQKLPELLGGLGTYTVGLIFMVGAAVGWAVYALTQKQLLNSLPSETIMLAVYIGGALAFFPTAQPGQLVDLGPLPLGLLVFTGFSTIFGYGAFSEALDHLEASRVSAVLATIPLMALAMIQGINYLWPGTLAGEDTNWLGLCGAMLVVTGSMTSSMAGVGAEKAAAYTKGHEKT